MSAAPKDISLVDEPGSDRTERLPRNARIYFVLVALTAAAVTIPFVGRLQTTHHWTAFGEGNLQLHAVNLREKARG